ncbi:ABC transporter permease [Streptomyces sp. NPDC091292]|uniref:ABC transporter permease n=1 Tax=Streptomyces sp. NPDC091292 TaxID=3365991 RepID=UPI003827037F
MESVASRSQVSPSLVSRSRLPVAQILFPVLLVVVWGQAMEFGGLDAFAFGTPGDTWHFLSQWITDGTLVSASYSTVKVLLIGWFIGTVAGIALGTAIGLSDFVRDVLDPFLAFFNGTPRLILYPFLAVWLGFNDVSKVVLVALVIVVVVTTIVASGFREVDGGLLDSMRIFGARTGGIVRDVYAPALTSWLVGVTRITIGYAFQAAITAEFVGSSNGLGYLLVLGESKLDVDQIWAGLVAIIVISWILDTIIGFTEKRLMRWSQA